MSTSSKHKSVPTSRESEMFPARSATGSDEPDNEPDITGSQKPTVEISTVADRGLAGLMQAYATKEYQAQAVNAYLSCEGGTGYGAFTLADVSADVEHLLGSGCSMLEFPLGSEANIPALWKSADNQYKALTYLEATAWEERDKYTLLGTNLLKRLDNHSTRLTQEDYEEMRNFLDSMSKSPPSYLLQTESVMCASAFGTARGCWDRAYERQNPGTGILELNLEEVSYTLRAPSCCGLTRNTFEERILSGLADSAIRGRHQKDPGHMPSVLIDAGSLRRELGNYQIRSAGNGTGSLQGFVAWLDRFRTTAIQCMESEKGEARSRLQAVEALTAYWTLLARLQPKKGKMQQSKRFIRTISYDPSYGEWTAESDLAVGTMRRHLHESELRGLMPPALCEKFERYLGLSVNSPLGAQRPLRFVSVAEIRSYNGQLKRMLETGDPQSYPPIDPSLAEGMRDFLNGAGDGKLRKRYTLQVEDSYAAHIDVLTLNPITSFRGLWEQRNGDEPMPRDYPPAAYSQLRKMNKSRDMFSLLTGPSGEIDPDGEFGEWQDNLQESRECL